MSTFATAARPEEDLVRPAAEILDRAIAQTRVQTPASVLERRSVPRSSIAELNDLDPDEIRARLVANPRDGRGPVQRVLDMIDAPRNAVASIVAPRLERKARESGERGAFGQGKVFMSDVLRELGVNNRVVAGIVGFGLDVAFDPLTYIGPAGWGAKVSTTAAKAPVRSAVIRAAGRRSLKRSILDVAEGRTARDDIWGQVIRSAGFDDAKLAELRAAGGSKAVRNEVTKALYGDVSKGLARGHVNRNLARVGGDLEHTGGFLIEKLNAIGDGDEAAAAVRAAFAKYGKGTEPGIAIGRKFEDASQRIAREQAGGSPPPLRVAATAGGRESIAAGSGILHVPFTDWSVRAALPEWWPMSGAGRSAVIALQLAKDRNSGLAGAAIYSPSAAIARSELVSIRSAASQMQEADENLAELNARADFAEQYMARGESDARGGREPLNMEGWAPEISDAYQQGLARGQASPKEPISGGFVDPRDLPPGPPGTTPLLDTPAVRANRIKEQYRELLTQIGHSRDQADATLEIYNALARTWAKASGSGEDDALTEILQGFELGTQPPQRGKVRGSIEWNQEQQALIRFMSGSDSSTLVHEPVHLATSLLHRMATEKQVGAAELAALEQWAGPLYVNGQKNAPAWEKIARDGEIYFRTGEPPPDATPALVVAMERIKTWITELFEELKQLLGDPRIDRQVSPEAKRFIDYMLGGKGVDDEARAARRGPLAGPEPHGPSALPPDDAGGGAAETGRAAQGAADHRIQGQAPRFRVRKPKPAEFTRAGIDDQLRKWYESSAFNSGVELTEAEMAEAGHDVLATTFRGPVPDEARSVLEGAPLSVRRLVRGNDPRGRGEDILATLGADEWARRLIEAAKSKIQKAIDAAEQVGDNEPAVKFMAWLRNEIPTRAQGRKPFEIIEKPSLLPENATFKIADRPFVVERDEKGYMLLIAEDSGDSFFLDAIDSVPMDRGTLRLFNPAPEQPRRPAGGAIDDLPFDPGDPLFQSDVPGQTGLFGQGKVAADVGPQRDLFDTRPAPQPPKENPRARRPGESDEDYRIRIKFLKAEQNTGKLFQADQSPEINPLKTPAQHADQVGQNPLQVGDIAPEQITDTPGASGAQLPLSEPPPMRPYDQFVRELEEARRTHDETYRAAIADVNDRINRIRGVIETADADAAAANIKTTSDLIAQVDAYLEAKAQADLLAARAEQYAAASRLVQFGGNRDRATALRQVSEDILELAENNPEGADRLADVYSKAFEAAGALAERLRGPIITIANGPESLLMDLAKSLVGISDDAVARSMFYRVGAALEQKGSPLATKTADLLFNLDEAIRRTVGVRGGYLKRAILGMKLAVKDSTVTQDHWAAAITKAAKTIADKHDVPAADLPAFLQLIHAKMYALADPGQQRYHWWQWSESGPGSPSGLLQSLIDARGRGWFARAEDDLNTIAQELLDEVNELGDVEIADHLLRGLMAGHVPIVQADDARRATRVQREAFMQNAGGGGEGFQKTRTTWQTRFPDQQQIGTSLLPGPAPRWRRFFEFERELARWEPVLQRAADGDQAAKLQLLREFRTEERLKEVIETIDAIKAYDALPDAAKLEHSPKPTDWMELNELYRSERFHRLVGDNPKVEEFFEGNIAQVIGARMAAHQRAVAKASGLKLLKDHALQLVDGGDLERVAQNGERTVLLRSGQEARVGGIVRTNAGGQAASVLVGDQMYRMLDPDLRKDLNNPLMSMFGKDINSMVVHHVLADAIEDAAVQVSDRNVHWVLRVADKVTSYWKYFTLMHPSWLVFNAIGDTWLALAGGADPRSMLRNSKNMMRLRLAIDDLEKVRQIPDFEINGVTVPAEQVRELLIKHRAFDNSLTLKMAAEIFRSDPGLLTRADEKMRRLVAPWFKTNQVAQDVVRGLTFLSFLDQGHDTLAAEQRMLRAVFDYGDFTRTEERIFRRLAPFYSWVRNNAAYQFRLFMERPMYAALSPKLKQAIEEATAGEAAVPENLRPSWLRESIAAQVGQDPEDRFAVLLENALPTGDLYHLLAPAMGMDGFLNFMHYFGSNVTPLISGPLQLAAGTEFYTGRRIGADAYSADVSIAEHATNYFRPGNEVGIPGIAGALAGGAAGARLGPGAMVAGALAGGVGTAALAGSGKLGAAFRDGGIDQGLGRTAIGGRVQSFDEARLDRGLEREFKEREAIIRSAVRRADRENNLIARREAFMELMRLYDDMSRRGLKVPAWARDMLAA
jgi:hypothetical protein